MEMERMEKEDPPVLDPGYSRDGRRPKPSGTRSARSVLGDGGDANFSCVCSTAGGAFIADSRAGGTCSFRFKFCCADGSAPALVRAGDRPASFRFECSGSSGSEPDSARAGADGGAGGAVDGGDFDGREV